MKTARSILMLLVAVAAMTGCDKNAVTIIAGPQTGGANVKFFNFAVGSPTVNFFVNNAKVTAVSATGCYLLTDTNRQQCLSTGIENTTAVAYGAAGNGANAWYSDVTPGQVSISGNISATTDNDLAIASVTTTVESGKFYSFYLSGIYDATQKKADAFVIEDVMPAQDFTTAQIRFVNASSTAGPLTLYAKDRTSGVEVPIGGLVAYKSAGAWVALPITSSYDFAARVAGSSTNLFSRSQLSFSGGRAYTITARGNTATSSTMALDNTANR